ncbi:MAG TPA: DUF2442 domain-containing protein [Blastocatellia bacterium]|jgi:hypothetical protein
MRKFHEIEKVSFDRDKLVLHVDGQVHTFNLSKISRRLANASAVERERFEISPSGYGIHWPLIDEDLSVDGLLGIVHSPRETKEAIPA